MSQTLLAMVQRVVRRLPLTNIPTTVVGSSDPGIKQLLEMFQQEGDELVSKSEWARLISTWTITVATGPQTEARPADYGRTRTNASFWRSGSTLTPMAGPVSPDEWQRLTQVSGGFPGYWRPYSTGVQILGVPIAETVTVEYVSDYWILDVDGTTAKALWSDDDDTSLLPDVLLILGAVWRWKQSKGLEYAEDMATYEREQERQIAADRMSRPASTARYYKSSGFPGPTWPGQITT